MSTPKKPGTDLAALKARLASKTKGPGAPEPMPAAAPPPPSPRPAAPPSDFAPPPAMPRAESLGAPPPSDLPPPGYSAPPPDLPPPGEPMRAMDPPAAPMHHAPMHHSPVQHAAPLGRGGHGGGDDPFGGAVGNFDPSEGLIDAGDVPSSRGSKGLVVFATLVAALLGALAGWQIAGILQLNEQREVGSTKGKEMLAEVQRVAETRKDVSLVMEEIAKKSVEDPAAAAQQISELMSTKFDKSPKVEALFGWQLASIHPSAVKKVFDLYDEANRLQLDLGYLGAFLQANAEALKGAGGPALFAVVFGDNGGTLVEAVAPMCGESAEKLDALQPCQGSDATKAIGYQIRTSIGAEPKVVARGTGEGQAQLLTPDGQIYQYAIGLEPAKNAMVMRAALLARVNERLEAMAKSEKAALTALQNYSDNPDVDGSSPQPDPGE